jgi:hypothetical protein
MSEIEKNEANRRTFQGWEKRWKRVETTYKDGKDIK